jgi:hypothetical protein
MPQTNFQPTWALIKQPLGYPEHPQANKIEMIFNTNSTSLYHRLSPYANYHQGVLTWGTQPFYWTYPDEAGRGLSALRKYESRLFPIGSAPMDVIRVSKFMVSGAGLKFMAKQFLLQTGNPYNETRIYNPTSPIVAAAATITFGSIRPQRFIDTSGGLLGIANSLFGPITNLFGEPKINPPSGTTGLKALSDPMKSVGGKGLIRAGTAKRAESRLLASWPATTGGSGGFGGFGKAVVGMVTSLFQNFIPQNQNGKEFRSDEGAYGLMIGAGNSKFKYLDASGKEIEFGQLWIGGGKLSRKDGQYPTQASRTFIKYEGGFYRSYQNFSTSGFHFYMPNVGGVGYDVKESTGGKPGYRYGDSVGESISTRNGEFYENSDVMVQYKFYKDQPFPTKNPDSKKQELNKINDTLKRTINAIKQSGVYTYTGKDSPILRNGQGTYDYDRLFDTKTKTTGKPSALNYPLGVLSAYRRAGESIMVDASISEMPAKRSVKLPTNGTVDAINTLEVLSGDKSINNSTITGWDKWSPYDDDLVAMYFYDVVNKKYIPFRTAIKGLNESANASWEEMSFIGRADKTYSYAGFTRNLSFNLNIVISSIAELLPTWQRINYITTAVKPGNYTQSDYAGVTNRFIVPPMFMLTLGDMYRDQPILFQAVTLTVPDDAAWETVNVDNYGDPWSYLSGMIKAPRILSGQFPREVEIGFTLYLLEKERAIVGGANFGHAPRRDDSLSHWNSSAIGGSPNKVGKFLVVNNARDDGKVFDDYEKV